MHAAGQGVNEGMVLLGYGERYAMGWAKGSEFARFFWQAFPCLPEGRAHPQRIAPGVLFGQLQPHNPPFMLCA